MLDLLFSAFGMLALSLAVCLAGARLQDRAGRGIVVLVMMIVAAGMGSYLRWIWDRPLLAQILPFSNAIILGNWLPVAAAFLIGICLRTQSIAFVRRAVMATTLGALCSYSLVSPLLGSTPQCGTIDYTGRIFEPQSTGQTCSAACAAGLLRLHGIDATEDELAQLCLTRQGTHWLGVFRGLKIKTAGTEWDVVVEEVDPKLLTRTATPPGILSLTFSEASTEHKLESGFGSNIGHTVVCLGTSLNTKTLEVFDPAPDYGFEAWNDRILADVETGILLRLVSRKGTPSPMHEVDRRRPSTWNDRRLASR